MGPIHRGTKSELQIMEEAKWRYMHHLLSRPTGNLQCMTLRSCCELLIGFDSIIRASYADGETMELGAEELARIMLLDGCFLLELLLKLHENVIPDPPLRRNQSDPSLDFTDGKKKILRVLTDLTLLENQIPFLVLELLSLEASPEKELSPEKLAESLFGCKVASAGFSKGVSHFLHLMHSCSPDPYDQRRDIHES
ncbi:UPF0481 protein At3g47200-like isoform X2 [Prosopis cineraria]|nr:UPF0481 protein At3g47200-like isoform X2 [Prosopis cineraria]